MRKNIYLILVIFTSFACHQKEKAALEIKRMPYLQSALGDSVSILWRTNQGSLAEVDFRQKGEKNWIKISGITRKTNTGWVENEVVIKGLEPDQRYEYKVVTDGSFLADQNIFWFDAPKANSDSSFTFYAVGDVGEPLEDGGRPDQLAKALEDQIDSLDFGVLLGDIIYPVGSSQVYDQNLFNYFGGVFPYVPVFTLLGNHDWHDPEDNYLLEWKLPGNEYYYSFDYANAHFIALDSKDGDFYEFEKQKQWLENELKTHDRNQEWLIVLLHHNGKSCTYKDDYPRVVELYPLFHQYGVDLVLNGHAHTYERLNPMDSLGNPIEEYLTDKNRYDQPTGFVSITAGSGGKLRGIGSDPKPYTPDPTHCKYPKLVAHSEHLWAYLKISIDGKKLVGKAISTETKEKVDYFEIYK